MDDARVVGPELEGAHVPRARQGDRQHKRPEYVAAVSGYGERRRHVDDEVRRAKLPAAGPCGRGRKIRRVPFGRAAGKPLLDEGQLAIAQSPLAGKRALPRFRLPRRHKAACRHLADQRRPLLHVVIREEAERRNLPRAMTRSTSAPDDRRDVPGEGERQRCHGDGGTHAVA